MIAPISVSWALERDERHTSTKPPAVTDSYLWANAYTKMNRGREKMKANRRGGILFSAPLLWSDLGQEALVYLQPCQTGITEIIRLYRDPRGLAKDA